MRNLSLCAATKSAFSYKKKSRSALFGIGEALVGLARHGISRCLGTNIFFGGLPNQSTAPRACQTEMSSTRRKGPASSHPSSMPVLRWGRLPGTPLSWYPSSANTEEPPGTVQTWTLVWLKSSRPWGRESQASPRYRRPQSVDEHPSSAHYPAPPRAFKANLTHKPKS